MQQRGTQAAHNALLRLGKREEAWRKQYIHTVANEIVSEAVEHDCDVIVFEELTDIRERLPYAKWHHIWAFRRLYEYVSYKAPEQGVSVEEVEPNHSLNGVFGRIVGSRTKRTVRENGLSARSVGTK